MNCSMYRCVWVTCLLHGDLSELSSAHCCDLSGAAVLRGSEECWETMTRKILPSVCEAWSPFPAQSNKTAKQSDLDFQVGLCRAPASSLRFTSQDLTTLLSIQNARFSSFSLLPSPQCFEFYVFAKQKWYMKLWGICLKHTRYIHTLWLFTFWFSSQRWNSYCAMKPEVLYRTTETKFTCKYSKDKSQLTLGISENLPAPPTTPTTAGPRSAAKQTTADAGKVFTWTAHSPWLPRQPPFGCGGYRHGHHNQISEDFFIFEIIIYHFSTSLSSLQTLSPSLLAPFQIYGLFFINCCACVYIHVYAHSCMYIHVCMCVHTCVFINL